MKNISYKFLLILFFFTAIILQTNLYSQVTQEWVRTYNGSGNGTDYITAMALDTSGNIFVTGYIMTQSQGQDYCTIKYNPSGVQQWVNIYSGISYSTDLGNAITVDKQGNVYVTGNSGPPEVFDWATIKYNSNGVQQWVARYNDSLNGDDRAYALAVDDFGNIYVTGNSMRTIGEYTYVYTTIKYNSNGVQQWIAKYNNPNSITRDRGRSIDLDNLNNVYVTGDMTTANGPEDFCTIKYNNNGIQQWLVTYNGTGNNIDFAKKIILDDAGNAYITGTSYGNGSFDDFATLKYNTNGVQQWVARYNSPTNNSDDVFDITIDKQLNIIITGCIGVTGGNWEDYATVKYTNSGVQQWVSLYNGPGNSYDEAYSVVTDDSNNIYITGRSIGTSGYDFATIKYNTNGVQQWLMRYPGVGAVIALDKLNNIYVAGKSNVPSDYCVIKYSQLVGIQNVQTNEVIKDFKIKSIYPNPMNPYGIIQYEIPYSSYVQIEISDILGRTTNLLENKYQTKGLYEISLQTSNYSSGIYFCRLISDGLLKDVKKILVVK